MARKILLGVLFFWGSSLTLQAQRRLTEATLVYAIHVDDKDSAATQPHFADGAISTSYLKGANSRTDLVTQSGKQSTIFISKSAQVVLLKEYGNQRYLTRMTLSQWERSNKKYREAGITLLSDTLRLKGYLCYKALATLADSTTFTIWYTKELNPLNKEFLPMAGSVPGLILSFETLLGDKKVRYEIDQIVLNPVQQVLFDIPESGYRVLELQHP